MFRYFWFLIFCAFSLWAAPIEILEADNNISILEHSEVYVEQNAKIQHPVTPKTEGVYKPYDSDFISRGYTTDEAVWVRFVLRNTSDKPLERMLHIDNSMLDSITLYEEGGQLVHAGVLNYGKFDGIIDFHLPLLLQPKETKTYYLRILSNSCATYFHLNVETENSLWLKNNKRELILTFFASVMIALAIYNGFIYAFTREKVYLYYVIFLIFATYNHFFSYAAMIMPFYYFFGVSDAFIEWFTAIDAYLGVYYMLVISSAFVLFFMELIDSKRFGAAHKILKSFLLIYALIGIISALGIRYSLDWAAYGCFTMLLFIMGVVGYLVYKKEENSLYLLLGQGAHISGYILFFSYNIGAYIPDGGYWYFYEMSLASDAFLFSIVLSKKLSRTKALETALATQKILIRELHHRVKNNLQFIVSLYRLKLKKHLSESGKEMLGEAEQNIRSIGKIHEILYNQQNISELSAYEYFGDLVNEIQRGYPAEGVNIRIDGEMRLSIDHAIYCGLIVNELVTNALKYAFADKGGNIDISLGKTASIKTLIIADNGVGYDLKSHKHSFGLSLVEKLAKDELKGELTTSINGGTSHTIKWG